MAIFLFSKWRPDCILLQVKNGVTAGCGLSMSTTVPNFVTVSQLAASYCVCGKIQYGGG